MSSDILPHTLRWENDTLIIIDQTKLPGEFKEIALKTKVDVYEAIKALKVRGAPAIGIAGAYGVCVCAKKHLKETAGLFMSNVAEDANFLNSSRPTAVNLSWGIKRVMKAMYACVSQTPEQMLKAMTEEAIKIHNEDLAICRSIGEHGKTLIKDGYGVLTHCNAGSLATSRLGTATAPMYMAAEDGVRFRVYADETRPLLQGSRLTAWELQKAGLDVTLICDNMAASMMAAGKINMVIVGTDRVAANGDVANKIGTLGVAVLAKHYGIPFYVACPSSTLDMQTTSGQEIIIEQRGNEEVRRCGCSLTAPADIKVENPAFDVTPAYLVKGIITEHGIIKPPYEKHLKSALKK